MTCLFLLWALLLPMGTHCANASDRTVPTGVVFETGTLFRSDGRGDNWCMTWARDGSLITSLCDGNWLGGRTSYHNRLYRITGDPERFQREEITGYPVFRWGTGSWFGYGIVSVDGVLYSAISKTPKNSWSGPFRGVKLLKSRDNGETWYRVNRCGEERLLAPDDEARNLIGAEEMFFFEEFGLPHEQRGAYPFSFLDFIQHGQDNGAARDGYVYILSPEGAHAHRLLLARVPKDSVGFRAAWEYFERREGNEAVWTRDLGRRGCVHEFPEKNANGQYFGWYSWLPSVVWNEGLGRYIMVNGGTYAGRGMANTDRDYYDSWMHTGTGSLGFWYAEHPWGPWTQFYYTDSWVADDPANRIYQPKLSPRWISRDGRRMLLIWSDAMRDAEGRSHTVNYRWNQMWITLETR